MSSSSRVAAEIDLADDSDDGLVMADSQMTTVDDADSTLRDIIGEHNPDVALNPEVAGLTGRSQY